MKTKIEVAANIIVILFCRDRGVSFPQCKDN